MRCKSWADSWCIFPAVRVLGMQLASCGELSHVQEKRQQQQAQQPQAQQQQQASDAEPDEAAETPPADAALLYSQQLAAEVSAAEAGGFQPVRPCRSKVRHRGAVAAEPKPGASISSVAGHAAIDASDSPGCRAGAGHGSCRVVHKSSSPLRASTARHCGCSGTQGAGAVLASCSTSSDGS